MEVSRFKGRVIDIVFAVPRGRVVSYGQVALYIGVPRAARQVGWTLNRMEGVEEIPWWRVVNNSGRISIKGSKYSAADQKRFLVNEGIKVQDDLSFDIEKYRFIPDKKLLADFKLDPIYLSVIASRLPYSKYLPKDLAKVAPKMQK